RDRKALPLGQAALEELIEEITVDAYGEDEQLWAFRQAFEENVALPAEGAVVGEPVVVVAFDYDGNERRGLAAKCRGADGRKHVVAAADVLMAPGTKASPYLAAYRKWMGLSSYPPAARSKRGKGRPTSERDTHVATGSVEVIVLSLKQKAARCRLLGD